MSTRPWRRRKHVGAMRLPFRYTASFVRGTERRTFAVHGWNKDDAYLEAKRRLEAGGDRETGPHGGGWWYVGAEREKF